MIPEPANPRRRPATKRGAERPPFSPHRRSTDSDPGVLAKRVGTVGGFPFEFGKRAAEVAADRGETVDRPQEVEALDDRARPQVEVLADERFDDGVAESCPCRRS
jgi:hypothetical protein